MNCDIKAINKCCAADFLLGQATLAALKNNTVRYTLSSTPTATSRVFILHTILLSFLIKNCNIPSINVSPKSTWIKGAHNIKSSSIFSDYTLKTVAKINLSNILILFHNYLIIKPLRISISFIHHVSKTTRYRQI